jgi:cytochrome P450
MADAQSYFNPWDPEFRAKPFSHCGASLAATPAELCIGALLARMEARIAFGEMLAP